MLDWRCSWNCPHCGKLVIPCAISLTVCSSNKGEEPDDDAVRCPFCRHTYESKWADGKLRAQAYSAYEKRKERLSPEEIGDWRRRNGLVWDEVDSLVGTRWEEGLEDGEIEPTLAEDSLLYLLMKNPDNLRLLRERFDAWRQRKAEGDKDENKGKEDGGNEGGVR